MANKSAPIADDCTIVKKYIDNNDGTWSEAVDTAVVGSNGIEAGVTQYGYLRTTQEPTPLFTDSFDSLDTTNKWTTKVATGTTTVVLGNLVMNSSTTASAYAGISTQTSFAPDGLNFLAEGLTVIVPNVVQANTLRFWGWGAVPATPTIAVPTANGVGFELSDTGVLTCVIYQNSVKTNTAASGYQPVDNFPFYTAIARRADRIDFYVNSTSVPVATFLIPALDVATLPGYMMTINGATPPAAAAQLICTAFGVATTGCNTMFLSDPANPQWRANVTKPSTAAAATNSALIAALHPSSPLNGQAAHDGAIAGSPVRTAGRAITAAYTTVATGDTADYITTLQGVQITKPWQIPELEWSYAAANLGIVNTTTAVTIRAAAGAGLRSYITSMQINTEALGTATELAVRDGAAGTVIWRCKIPTAGIPFMMVKFDCPLKSTANTLLEVVTLTASVTGAVYVNAQGYTAP